MSNVAVIFAGGAGKRMKSSTKPKQFLELYGKPIIIYTLEQFQDHPEIDGIIVVCKEDWMNYCQRLIDRYQISKAVKMVAGGENGQGSIRNGIYAAAELYSSDSVVLVHDGVRPLVDASTISK